MWNYQSNDAQAARATKIGATATIDGKLYYEVEDTYSVSNGVQDIGEATIYFRKENGSYYQRVETDYTGDAAGNIVVTPMEVEILRDDLPVDGTWSGVSVQDYTYEGGGSIMSTTYNNSFKIMEKGVTVTVGTTTYNDVIKVRHIQNSRIEIGGIAAQNVQITIYNWYAKNVGLIKTQAQGQQTGTDILTTLTSYTLH